MLTYVVDNMDICADHSSPEFTSIQYTVLTLFSKLFVFRLFFVIIYFLTQRHIYSF